MARSKPPHNRSKGKMSGGKPTAPKRGRVTKKPEIAEAATRMMDQRVKTARGRKISSTLWLKRQLNDPYVKLAGIKGYRSRAAFKLIELNEKFNILEPGATIVDLGAAPGGWCQIALEHQVGHLVGIDILPMETIAGADLIEMDFMDDKAPQLLIERLGGKADLVMSDLAANTTGHRKTDHMRTIALVEAAADFALSVLKPGGNFVSKVFQGGAEKNLLDTLKARFETVRHAKPKSSRAGSPEMYLVAKGFRPLKANPEPSSE